MYRKQKLNWGRGVGPGMQLPRSSHMIGWLVFGYTNTFVSPMSLSVMPNKFIGLPS